MTRRSECSEYLLLSLINWRSSTINMEEAWFTKKDKSDTFNEFETKGKSWYSDQCTCTLCNLYIGQLCFLGSIHASFSGRISFYVLDTKAYLQYLTTIPVNIYLFKVSNRNIGRRSETCSKRTLKAQTTSRQIFAGMLP